MENLNLVLKISVGCAELTRTNVFGNCRVLPGPLLMQHADKCCSSLFIFSPNVCLRKIRRFERGFLDCAEGALDLYFVLFNTYELSDSKLVLISMLGPKTFHIKVSTFAPFSKKN